MKKIRILKTIAIILFIGMFYACSDSSTGTDNDRNTPEIPSIIENVSVDISYFKNNSPNIAKNVIRQKTSNYYQAKTWASFVGSAYVGILTAQSEFVQALQSIDNASFKNGQWVWVYTLSQKGISLKYKLTAKNNSSGGYSWKLYYSINS